jgi:hypothetical protein
MTIPIPSLKPINTGSEIKLAIKPRRSKEASVRTAPTKRANKAVALSRDDGSPLGTTSPSSAAVRIAMVVVVLTLSTREVPMTA